MKNTKCNNCGKTDVFRLHKTGDYFWVRCARCGFHTSSYTIKEEAQQAAKDGEHYISENGNKIKPKPAS